VTGKKGNKKEH